MKRIRSSRFIGRSIGLSLVLSALLISGVAWAGELKFGAQPLEVDDKGAITKAGRSASSNDLASVSADEELWMLNVWAKIDKGANGPLYFEFYRDHDGGRLIAYSHEHRDYAGDKYVSLTIELARDMGFRFDDELTVEAVQIGDNDKKKVLAKAKLKLGKGTSQPDQGGFAGDGGGDDGGADDEGGEDPVSDQDIADSFAGGDEPAEGGDAPDAEPPPIEPESKKGCRIDDSSGLPWAIAIMLALGLTARRKD